MADSTNIKFLKGKVIKGYGRGSTELGFPTANLEMPHGDLNPDLKNGIYAGLTLIDDKWLPSAVNIGYCPYYNNKEKSYEIHIIDFERDLYGTILECKIIQYIRPEKNFSSLEELIQAINEVFDLQKETKGLQADIMKV